MSNKKYDKENLRYCQSPHHTDRAEQFKSEELIKITNYYFVCKKCVKEEQDGNF